MAAQSACEATPGSLRSSTSSASLGTVTAVRALKRPHMRQEVSTWAPCPSCRGPESMRLQFTAWPLASEQLPLRLLVSQGLLSPKPRLDVDHAVVWSGMLDARSWKYPSWFLLARSASLLQRQCQKDCSGRPATGACVSD